MFRKSDLAINPIDIFISFFCLLIPVGTALIFLRTWSAIEHVSIALAIALAAMLLFRTKIRMTWRKEYILVIGVLAGLMALRLPAFLYALGGQDQGEYVLISKYIQKSGSLYIDKNAFDQRVVNDHIDYAFTKSLGQDHMGRYMVLYPGYPVMMALFADFLEPWFGERSRVFYQSFAAMLSLLIFYLLARDLSGGSNTAGFVCLILLGIHPLHVFFSKFPVTEMPTLAFTGAMIWYSFKYVQAARQQKYQTFWLFCVAAAWSAFLFTRMSSIIYLPIMYIIALGNTVLNEDAKMRRQINGLLLALLLLFGSAWSMYRAFMSLLYYPAIDSLVMTHLGSHAEIKLAGILSMLAAVLITLNWKREIAKGFFTKCLADKKLKQRLLFFVLVLLAAVVIRQHNIQIKTKMKYLRDLRVGTTAHDLRFPYLTAWNVFIGLSPFCFVLWIASLFRAAATKNIFANLLLLFSLVLTSVMMMFNPFAYGGFYYWRYVFSEVVPYGLLLVVIMSFLPEVRNSWSSRQKKVTTVLLSLTGLFYAIHTVHQFKGEEGIDYKFFHELVAEVTTDNVLVTHRDECLHGFYNEIFGAIRHIYDIPSFEVKNRENLRSANSRGIFSKFKRAFILCKFEQKDQPDLQLVKTLDLNLNIFNSQTGHLYMPWIYRSGEIDKPHGLLAVSIPTGFSSMHETYYLYEILPPKSL
jgi:ABC-type multidrug transport system fused ATPase/permease subunit